MSNQGPGQIDAAEAMRGTRASCTYAFAGDDLVVHVTRGPWAGVARLRR
jgi:hypothetical protein